ncbi:MAG: hypothetical protein Aurels2KO_35570 [Aureliella sp.]
MVKNEFLRQRCIQAAVEAQRDHLPNSMNQLRRKRLRWHPLAYERVREAAETLDDDFIAAERLLAPYN